MEAEGDDAAAEATAAVAADDDDEDATAGIAWDSVQQLPLEKASKTSLQRAGEPAISKS